MANNKIKKRNSDGAYYFNLYGTKYVRKKRKDAEDLYRDLKEKNNFALQKSDYRTAIVFLMNQK